MRIRVREEKIVKAVKRLEGIDIVLRTADDAREAIGLVLRRTEKAKTSDFAGLKDFAVTRVVEHATSAVEYHTDYEIQFILADSRYAEMEIALIKELQAIFEKP
jgi:hypothetical protein